MVEYHWHRLCKFTLTFASGNLFNLKLSCVVSLLGSELPQIINDSAVEVDSRSSDFWVLVAALKVNRHLLNFNYKKFLL